MIMLLQIRGQQNFVTIMENALEIRRQYKDLSTHPIQRSQRYLRILASLLVFQ